MPNSLEYKVEVYNVDGEFVADISSKATLNPFTSEINNGLQLMNVDISERWDASLSYAVRAYEVRVYELVSDQRVIYSGFIRNVRRQLSLSGEMVVLECSGYVGRLEYMKVLGSGNALSVPRHGDGVADVGSLDSEKTSDVVKYITRGFRARSGTFDIIQNSRNQNLTFGSTTRRAQSFTTGTDAEKNLLTGLFLVLRFNSSSGGTRGDIFVQIKTDSSDTPNGTILATERIGADVIANDFTPTGWHIVWLQTPIQLSPSTKYWIQVSSGSSTSTSTYIIRAANTNPYADGTVKTSTDSGGTWSTTANNDFTFRTMYVEDERVRVDEGEIADSGDSKEYTITDLNSRQALDYVSRYGPNSWYWFLDAENKLRYQPVGFVASKILDNCDSASGFTNGQGVGSITLDSVERIEGSGSVRFTLLGTHDTPIIEKDISSKDLTDYTHAGCWVFIPEETSAKLVIIRLWSTGQTALRQWAVNVASLIKGQWNWITPLVEIQKDPHFEAGGTFDIADVDRISFILILDDSSETSTWYIDDFTAGVMRTHNFHGTRDVVSIKINEENVDQLRNSHIFSNNSDTNPIVGFFRNEASIEEIGIFEDSRVDSRFDVLASVNAVGNSYVAQRSRPSRSVTVEVPANSPFFNPYTIEPGHLIKLNGFEESLDLNEFFVVIRVQYDSKSVTIEANELGSVLSSKVSEIEKKLDLLQSASGSTGDTPEYGAIT